MYVGWSRNAVVWPPEGLSLAFAPAGLGKVWGEIRNCAWKKGATDDPVRQCPSGKSANFTKSD